MPAEPPAEPLPPEGGKVGKGTTRKSGYCAAAWISGPTRPHPAVLRLLSEVNEVAVRSLMTLAAALLIAGGAGGTLTVLDEAGRPLRALVYVDDGRCVQAGAGGKAELPADAGTIRVAALGYKDYSGPVPVDSTVVLAARAVPSGVVIPVVSGDGLGAGIPSTTRLGEEVLAASPSGLSEKLNAHVPGLYARAYGGGMQVVSMSVRGAEAGQTGFTVAGHSLQSPLDGLGPGELDLGIFGGLEVARGGAASSRPGAISGTINLLPRPPGLRSVVETWGGTDGTAGARTALGIPSGSLALSLRRLPGERGGGAASAVVSVLGRRWRWGGLAQLAEGETEPPSWSPEAVGWRRRSGAAGWVDGEIGPLLLSMDCQGEIMEYGADFPEKVDDTHRHLSMTGEVTADATDWLALGAGGGMELARSTALGFHHRLSGHGTVSSAGRVSGVSVASKARLTATAGGETGASASLSASTPVLGIGTSLYASASRSIRLPTFNDLYWPEDAFARGNPDLTPEHATEAELGMAGAWGGIEASACGYAGVTEDQITWLPDAAGTWAPGNVARVERMGVEIQAAFATSTGGARGSITVGSSVDRSSEGASDGCRMPYRPDVVGGLECFLNACGLRLSADVSGRSLSYRNRTQTDYLPGYWLLGAAVSVPLTQTVEMTISGRNLTDREYEVTDGYPGQGRRAKLMLQWKGGARR